MVRREHKVSMIRTARQQNMHRSNEDKDVTRADWKRRNAKSRNAIKLKTVCLLFSVVFSYLLQESFHFFNILS